MDLRVTPLIIPNPGQDNQKGFPCQTISGRASFHLIHLKLSSTKLLMNSQSPMTPPFHPTGCRCCGPHHSPSSDASGFTRRHFLAGVGAATVGTLVLPSFAAGAAGAATRANRPGPRRLPLKVQPVLVYETPQRREATSWRNWGSVHSDQSAAEEQTRINAELATVSKTADFPLEVRPVVAVKTSTQVGQVLEGDHDVLLMYAAGGGLNLLEQLTDPKKWTLLFVRHRSGPAYLWYEIAHNRYLRKTVDEFGQPGMDVQDVVVDRHEEVLWRLRALHGLKNTLGKKIVALGGAGGWGDGGRDAPDKTKNIWGMDIANFSYEDLGKRIKEARRDSRLRADCDDAADRYLKQRGVTLETDRGFVQRAFLLTEVFKDILDAADTDAFTINQCMGTVMPMSETTACLPLSLLNDEGYLAFCESDFVVIPSGILLHYISGKPVFLNDPTYPYENLVTLAHCTAPRKLDGKNLEPARILTHFESDYGAAPKVEMRLGQQVTTLIPDFASRKWVGFSGNIVANPFLDICRSQIDVEFRCRAEVLLREMKGFHWMMGYGDYLREIGYALKKVGVEWLNLDRSQAT